MCNHSFHCSCLAKWKDNYCPLCRFVPIFFFFFSAQQLTRFPRRYVQQPHEESPICSICKTTESLWICLICGNVGCGRYVRGHAWEHYKTSMHTYSLELHTGRVWDYAGDGYVHRLIQNKSDGKLVELNASSEKGKDGDLVTTRNAFFSFSYFLCSRAKRSLLLLNTPTFWTSLAITLKH
jgi:BRCA1-associated protein